MAVNRGTSAVFLLSIFCVAVCGLVYELLAGTMSCYLLRDSVYQFSIVIGLFVSSMGLGSFLSRYVAFDLADVFVATEIVIGVLGGYSAVILFYAFSVIQNYNPFLFLVSASLGALIGLEIPLVLRLLKDGESLETMISNVFTMDYIGALAASLLFPLVLVPRLGLMRTGFLFGLINVGVAFIGLYAFRGMLRRRAALFRAGALAAAALLVGFHQSARISSALEDDLYKDKIIFSRQTKHQRVVLTRDPRPGGRGARRLSLFIDGRLQFNSEDEYRYHEALVHPAMALARKRDHVLVLGAGDGLALREVLKYRDVGRVTVVDIDKAITDLFSGNPLLAELNARAFADPKVEVVNQDAWAFLERSSDWYDVVIIDFPDPANFDTNKLYSTSFYQLVAKRLPVTGVMVTQAADPLRQRKAFWSIYRTISETPSPWKPLAKPHTRAYHVYVPSFGEQGFVLASPSPFSWERIELKVPVRFLSASALAGMVEFAADMSFVDADINSIDTHKVMAYQSE